MCPPADPPDDDDDELARRRARPSKDDQLRAETALTVRELVLFEGETLPPQSTARIVRLGSAALAPLIEILVDSTLRAPNSPGAGRGPVHAAVLLGRIDATRAMEPLLDVLATAPPPSELYDAVTDALKPLRAALISPILDLLPTAVGTYRQDLWMLLATAEVRDPRIFDQLLIALTEQPEEGAMRLAEYGDRAALPHLQKALDAFKPGVLDDSDDDRIVFELAEAIEDLGGKLTAAQKRKYEHARITREVENSVRTAREQPYDPEALCFCKSGRQYKYCCLQ